MVAMPRLKVTNDAIACLLYQHMTEKTLNTDEAAILKRWTTFSVYNRSVLHDVLFDEQLRSLLFNACSSDQSKFWTILISYRAAMHADMGERSGNFWNRMAHPVTRLFRKNFPD